MYFVCVSEESLGQLLGSVSLSAIVVGGAEEQTVDGSHLLNILMLMGVLRKVEVSRNGDV
jgi:hypothetical protein